MKFFGLSFKDLSGTVKLIYVAIFVLVIGGFISYGLSKLDNTKKQKTPTKRRSPKKDKWCIFTTYNNILYL